MNAEQIVLAEIERLHGAGLEFVTFEQLRPAFPSEAHAAMLGHALLILHAESKIEIKREDGKTFFYKTPGK